MKYYTALNGEYYLAQKTESDETTSSDATQSSDTVGSDAIKSEAADNAESYDIAGSDAAQSSGAVGDGSDTTNSGIKIEFAPTNFVLNLKYMGQGMLGIFVAIFIIAVLTVILNKVTRKKS